MDAPVAHQLVAAPQHAGVAQLCAQIVVAQVGVRVKVDNVYLRVMSEYRAEAAQRHQMLAAQQHGQLAVPQDHLRPLLDVAQRLLRAAEAQLQIAAVEHRVVRQVRVLIGAVRLQHEALVPHRRRAKPRAGAEGRRGVKRRAEQHDGRVLVKPVAADKGLNVPLQRHYSSTSSSISSRKAGSANAPMCSLGV